ncbi:MAG: restriction endonuclease subunit S [Candidatus Accumulibacter phosphatis]|uniref:restriction endonuclease subunit S n=1 Tax=Accumulibacter sp. TaxID=2053492 RepID=UPI001A3D4EC6|nr:restriction endonuclease subunit S [Accumulibacter sp.]MBL8401559.1 restriction endonuclease subunit S [Accumulibacter sp.]MCQ1550291.1 restriction endonuclease subunit S [Candidatus Accumulibacter phosphatis]
MDVIPGFKQSAVGLIPAEWEAKRLGELGSVVRGGSPRPAGDPRYFNGDFIPWLTVAALTNIPDHQLRVTETASALTEEGSKRSRTLVNGTVIIANSGATLGVAKLLGVTCCANDGIAAITNQRSGNKAFVCHYINTRTKRLREVVASGNGQPNLNTALIREIPIPFPPLPEQLAIAGALSDVDALLGALDRLIAKKRDLKQAAMHQLLTGQTRLPGFHGEWEVKRLGTLLRFQVGFPFSSAFFNEKGEGIRLVKNRDLKSDDQIFHYSGKYDEAFVVRDDDVLIGMDGDFRPCLWNKGSALLNQRVGRLVPKEGLNSRFAFYVLIEPLKAIEVVTSSTTVKHLSHGDAEGIEISMPEFPEQAAIAEVLSDMDAELATLAQRRDKTRALKQAMMQELLTGRTRLA